jgi:hypothetical protein
MTYTVTSSDPSLVKPTITGTTLSFAYGAGSGVAEIDVVGTSFDGSKATEAFDITVPDATQPNEGPTANDYTAPDVLTGTPTTLHPLENDADSLAAIDPGTVTILTAAQQWDGDCHMPTAPSRIPPTAATSALTR